MSNENKQNDERAAFEAWWLRDVPEAHREFAKKLLDGYGQDYAAAPGVADAWTAWQAGVAAMQTALTDEQIRDIAYKFDHGSAMEWCFSGASIIDFARALLDARAAQQATKGDERAAFTMTDDALKRFGKSQYRDGYAQGWHDAKDGKEPRETTVAGSAGQAPSDMKEGRWCPDECPITGLKFFMWLDHPELGYVPTYGGPFDSYTLAALDEDGLLRSERYDHDRGEWIEGGHPMTARDELIVAAEGDEEECLPTPESERAAFNGMMCWHLIRLLQAWRYGGDLRAAGMAAFEWARANDVGQEAFKASEKAVKIAAPTAPSLTTDAGAVLHSDDIAVDKLAAAMKEKLAQARAKGRGGWEQCDPSDLSIMLREHVEKGDPRDVANFCAFLWNLNQPIT